MKNNFLVYQIAIKVSPPFGKPPGSFSRCNMTKINGLFSPRAPAARLLLLTYIRLCGYLATRYGVNKYMVGSKKWQKINTIAILFDLV